ncbi:MAG: hypothetical protein K0B00_06560 [Rhodobacteraceae bacterium]|nr:hypothetical protein [Paracoccaceae bacterium]
MKKLKSSLLLAVTLAFVLSPLFVTSFQGYDPAAFPVPVFEPPVQPAGWAFSIWGLIYAWLIAHAVYGLWRHPSDPRWDAPRWPLIGSLALGVSWLEVANRAPILATVQIVAMLALALWALARSPRGPQRWWRITPVALYAGWLTAASGVSAGVVLIGYGVAGAVVVTLAILALLALVALWQQSRNRQAPEYALAVVWALGGIIAANLGAYPALAGAALLAIVALVVNGIRRAPTPA